VGSIDQAPVLLVVAADAEAERAGRLRDAGVELIVAAGREPADRVGAALAELGRRGITSILLEGGPRLAGSFAAAGEIDQLALFVAPILLGGGRSPLEGEGEVSIAEGLRALALQSEPVGDDVLIEARMREW
jgi:diaminohydroxyphosphoribosylaminopyrimidine deaminase / 5-amino-6-(5-phosphoribosylamino)uracil reductase